MMARRWSIGVLLVAALLVTSGCGEGGEEAAPVDLILATTTSTQDSGLLDAILPAFEASSDCVPKPVAVGSGEAMALGASGDADVLLVHSPEAEEEFMAEGHGSGRAPVMHNDFVLVGPPQDPADVDGAGDAAAAMERIAQAAAPFASRADDSGTHARELALWREAGIDPSGSWYVETGQGMGETLTIASQTQAYTLADRGTFLSTSNLESEIVFERSADLRNPYHVIVVEDGGATNVACAQQFSRWIRSEPAQQAIGHYGIDEYGEPLFHADAS